MKKEFLITGAAGFCGSHQVDKAIFEGNSVVAVDRPNLALENLENALASNKLTLVKIDLTNLLTVESLIESYRPRIIIHLAAYSNVSESVKNPVEIIKNNFTSTLNLLDAVRRYSPNSTVVLTGSAQEYGSGRGKKVFGPLRETTPIRPENPYAISKALENLLMGIYKAAGIQIVKARCFNHCGSRRTEQFFDGKLFRQAVEAKKKGETWVAEIVNKDLTRDWQHVANWNDANLVLTEKGTTGEVYNVCSGEGHSLEQLIDAIASTLGLQVEILENPDQLRPGDPLKIWGDNTKLKKLGWHPGKNFEQMIEETVAWWKAKLK